ncbi:MAG TPA: glycosyltransferase [Anaerohalosphaeraceae bacterium]|nr:glycosyltransferase [Anaerohalosphaeraceae bacterium]HOL87661.1 glycosyltransferase [Anaerohalosphaeraceae bacterium]HPP55832.1 glycosyltransferase [Anaerohalosphaeraceae bacterium]
MIVLPSNPRFCVLRKKAICEGISLQEGLLRAKELAINQQYLAALDLYEQLYRQYPQEAVQILAGAYDSIYRILREKKNRYWMYQARYFDFQIGPQDKVLDIGSGHMPFPFATHLADFAIEDNTYGRAGEPFRMVEGKKIFQCNVEKMPFADKEFDFVYCSHVLEHAENPEQACRELMRIAKRGYIETPTKGKDIFFDSARVSHHRWSIDLFNHRLVFTEYHPEELKGLECNVLGRMVSDPKTEYEKAFYALHFLRADMLNVMLYWEDQFEYEVRRFSNLPEGAAVSNAAVSVSDGCFRGTAPQEPRFSFVMIVLNGMPFIEYSLKSIYEFAHEIIIVEGAVEKCLFAANPDGSSKDGTVEFLRTFPDPSHKIRLIQGRWPEKCEMQNEALRYVTGDYVWLIDSDEVYKREDLEKIRTLLKNDPSITQVNFIPDNFWKGLDYIFVSPKFFEPAHHYRRLFQFRPGAVFISHRPPTLRWPGSSQTTEQMKLLDGQTTRRLGIIPFHYSYVTEEQVRQKIELYRRYGWGRMWNLDLQEWYEQCFLKWTPENREEIEKKWPVWTGDRDSHTERFTGTHPEVMRDFMVKVRTASAADAVFPEEKTLPILGSPAVAAQVLQNWQMIEADEPIRNRIAMIQKHLSEGKPFWNLYVALAYTAARLKPKSYLEIGVRTGASMVQVLGQSELDLAVGVDLWTGCYSDLPNTREYTQKQLRTFLLKTGCRTEIHLIQGDSHRVLKQLIQEGRRFDLITVDGDHSQVGAWEDLLDAKKLLADRGVIVFDDLIHPQFSYLLETAKRFVREFPEFKLLLNTKQDNGTALFLKGILPEEFLHQDELTSAKSSSLKVAEEYVKNGMAVKDGSAFAEAIARVFLERRPRKIIETGTYLGRGTTTILAEAMRRSGIEGTFFTIEVNPNYYAQAKAYLESRGYPVKPLCGLSIPRRLLPARDQIQAYVSQTAGGESIFVDHPEPVRAERYYQETDFPDVPDDLLGQCLEAFDGRPDFVLLDSAGHLGWIEFQYLLERLKGPCILALDDIYHVKHYRSFQQMQNDKRFEILAASKEKFGFCIARFEPQPKPRMTAEPLPEPKHILWLRPDAIGDGVLSASMLPVIRRRFPKARLTVLVEESTAPLYEACPYVDEILRFSMEETYKPAEFLQKWAPKIWKLQADWLLHSVYSRQYLMDGLVYLSRIPVRIGMEGDCTNISPEQKAESDRWYTHLISSPGVWKSELERHRDFLKGLGCETESLKPMIWLTKEDEAFARRWFEEHNVAPERAVILFAGARVHLRLYEGYGMALEKTALRRQMTVIALGSKSDYEMNQRNLEPLSRNGVQTFNLCGGLTLHQSAALIKYARLAVGAETGLAHIAAALEVPHVIVIGGGHFGRFMPYSSKTTLAALPLDCYGCNWNCRYSEQKTYCIQDLQPFVLSEAVEKTLESPADKPRIFIPDSASYQKADGGPEWKLFENAVPFQNVEIYSVSGRKPLSQRGKEKTPALSRPKEFSIIDNPHEFTYSKRWHFQLFQQSSQELFGRPVDPDNWDLKRYQDLLVCEFLKRHIPKGSRILDVGGGNSRILSHFCRDYECWNIDPLKGDGYGPVDLDPKGRYKLVRDYMGNFNSELPDNYFDFVFSISTLEHVPEDPKIHQNIRDDINRVLKPGGYSFHLVDTIIRPNGVWVHGQVKNFFFTQKTLNRWVEPQELINDPDLYTMSKSAYEKWWMPANHIPYESFGRPFSYQVLWQKAPKPKPQGGTGQSSKSSCIEISPQSTWPKITVVTPSFNQAKYLEACIQSVLNQGYPNLEYIIMDGGSTDGSVEIIKKYEKYLTYWQSKPDGGQYAAVEEGFRRSTGEILTWLNSDDIFLPDAFFKTAAIFQNRPDVSWLMAKTCTLREDGTIHRAAPCVKLWNRARYLQKDYKYIQQEGTFWRRSLWEKAGACLKKESYLAGDLELWMRFFRYADLFTAETYLGAFRYHTGQKTADFLEQYNREAEAFLEAERQEYEKQPPELRPPLRPAPPPISELEISRYLRTLPSVKPKKTVQVASSNEIRVSAIVSTYNSEAYIAGCLENLIGQTLYEKGQLEILVIDSGSQQNEGQIVREYQAEYPNIRYLRTPQRETIYAAWNRAVRLAAGRYLTSANTDDRYRSDALEILADTLDAHSEVGLVYGDQIISPIPLETFSSEWGEKIPRPDYTYERLLFGCCVGSQPMWRKSLHEELGYFDESLTVAGDWDFWLRIAARYPFKRVPEFLGIYYNNPNSAEHRNLIHSYYERYLVGKRYGNPYISTIPRCVRKDNPLVSVIMPAHNAREFIGEAIESVLIQNYPHFELLVINDGSEDDTEAVIKRYEDERIRYFVQERGGPSAARNEGIRRSKGEFFVMLDADDCLSADHLGQMLDAFDEYPEADLIYCKTILIDEEGRTIQVHQQLEFSDSNQLIREFFHAGFPLLPFRTMIRRRVFEQIGEYDPSLWVAEDFDMWRRFLKQGLVFRYWPKSFYGRRIRENAWSKTVTPEKAATHFSVLRRYLDTFAPEQLFPEAQWESYQGLKREYLFRSLAAGVFVSLAEQYKKNGLSPYLIQSAAELAMEQIRICRSLCSDQPVPLSLEQRCENLLIDAGAVGVLQEIAAGCSKTEVESCK